MESKCKIEWLSQNVLWLVWSSARTTCPAGGCPLWSWKPVTAGLRWGRAALSFIRLPIFHEVYRNFISLRLLPLCEGVLKLSHRFQCWEGWQRWQKFCVSTPLSKRLCFLRRPGSEPCPHFSFGFCIANLGLCSTESLLHLQSPGWCAEPCGVFLQPSIPRDPEEREQ